MSQRRANIKLKGVVSYITPSNVMKAPSTTNNNLSSSSRQNTTGNLHQVPRSIIFLDQTSNKRLFNNMSYSQSKNSRSTSKKSGNLIHHQGTYSNLFQPRNVSTSSHRSSGSHSQFKSMRQNNLGISNIRNKIINKPLNDGMQTSSSSSSLAKYYNDLSKSFKKNTPSTSSGLHRKTNSKNFQTDSNQLNLSSSTRNNNLAFRKMNRENKNTFSNLGTKETSLQSSEQVFSSFGSKTSMTNNKNYTEYTKESISKNKDIDTPEELHFFYVHVFQHGKDLENKF